MNREENLVVSVRTVFQTDWCCLEMIGSLDGRDAEQAARLAVIQVAITNCGKLFHILFAFKFIVETTCMI